MVVDVECRWSVRDLEPEQFKNGLQFTGLSTELVETIALLFDLLTRP